MKLSGARAFIGLTVALSGGAGIAGTVVFDNVPSGSYNAGTGWTLSQGAPLNTDFDQGDAFVPSDSGFLSDVYLAVGLVTGQNELDLWLMDDVAGVPGSILESMHISGQMGAFGAANPLIHAVASGTTFLDETKTYWLVASTVEDSWAAWNLNSIGDVGPHASRQDMAPFSPSVDTRGAMRVEVNVPEPATLALLGLAALVLRRRR